MSAPLLASPVMPSGAGPLPRLLAGTAGGPVDLAGHHRLHQALPVGLDGGAVTDLVARSGLLGRGGAAFPLERKLTAVRDAVARRGVSAVVVANAAESEPASAKDRVLLSRAPHLVLDGLSLVAAATGASTAYLYVHADRGLVRAAAQALADRAARRVDAVPVTLVQAPARFIAGEESAVVHRLAGGDAVPTYTPELVSETGLAARPTLVSNVETLAHLALIARHGAPWFRSLGTDVAPGTMLVTLHRAGHQPGVREVAIATALADLLPLAGTQAVLIGGYHGSWVPAAQAVRLRLDDADLAAVGARRGAGVLAALPADRCGLVESARVLRYLALESAGQCGPCLNGLPRIAAAMADLATGRAEPAVLGSLRRWAGLVAGRGACHHPDGSVRFLGSTLSTFADETELHLRGRCSRPGGAAFLPTPGVDGLGGGRR
jgi:NADH:ubiquinone oxidoreductase subunit F (NADH-binding)